MDDELRSSLTALALVVDREVYLDVREKVDAALRAAEARADDAEEEVAGWQQQAGKAVARMARAEERVEALEGALTELHRFVEHGTWTRFDEHPHAAEFDRALAARRASTDGR